MENMDPTYEAALNKYNSAVEETFLKNHEVLSADGIKLDDYARKVLDTARSNRYVLDSCYGKNPRVFIWDYTHPEESYNVNQADELANILKGCTREGDAVLFDGYPAGEVNTIAVACNSLAQKIYSYLRPRKVKLACNDDRKMLQRSNENRAKRVALNRMHGFDFESPQNLVLIQELMEIIEERYASVCFDENFGIIPLYEKLGPNSRIHQTCEQFALRTNNIQKSLEDPAFQIPYLLLVPEQNPVFREAW